MACASLRLVWRCPPLILKVTLATINKTIAVESLLESSFFHCIVQMKGFLSLLSLTSKSLMAKWPHSKCIQPPNKSLPLMQVGLRMRLSLSLSLPFLSATHACLSLFLRSFHLSPRSESIHSSGRTPAEAAGGITPSVLFLENIQGSLKDGKFRIGSPSGALSWDQSELLDFAFGTCPKVCGKLW